MFKALEGRSRTLSLRLKLGKRGRQRKVLVGERRWGVILRTSFERVQGLLHTRQPSPSVGVPALSIRRLLCVVQIYQGYSRTRSLGLELGKKGRQLTLLVGERSKVTGDIYYPQFKGYRYSPLGLNLAAQILPPTSNKLAGLLCTHCTQTGLEGAEAGHRRG